MKPVLLAAMMRRSAEVSEMAMSAKYLAVAAMLTIGVPGAVQAQEQPLLQGNYHIVIYNGEGGGSAGSANSQALDGNPLLGGSPVATLNCVGALNFGVPRTPPQESDLTIGGFLDSGASSANCTVVSSVAGFRGTILSSGDGSDNPPFQRSSVFDITFTASAIPDGLIRHDDGVGLYVGEDLLTPGATAPTIAVNTSFDSRSETLPNGALRNYRLIYVAANGNPSILRVWGTPVAPTPDFVDFGCQIDLTQTEIDPPFNTILSAVGSEKFCPQNNGGVLKLGCSGSLPGYEAEGTVTLGSGVVCRISGSQCGLPGEFLASVKSISIGPGGFTQLNCEATPPGPG